MSGRRKRTRSKRRTKRSRKDLPKRKRSPKLPQLITIPNKFLQEVRTTMETISKHPQPSASDLANVLEVTILASSGVPNPETFVIDEFRRAFGPTRTVETVATLNRQNLQLQYPNVSDRQLDSFATAATMTGILSGRVTQEDVFALAEVFGVDTVRDFIRTSPGEIPYVELSKSKTNKIEKELKKFVILESIGAIGLPPNVTVKRPDESFLNTLRQVFGNELVGDALEDAGLPRVKSRRVRFNVPGSSGSTRSKKSILKRTISKF